MFEMVDETVEKTFAIGCSLFLWNFKYYSLRRKFFILINLVLIDNVVNLRNNITDSCFSWSHWLKLRDELKRCHCFFEDEPLCST